MRWLFTLASVACFFIVPAFAQNANEPSNAKFGNKIGNFTLKSADGKATSLYDLKDRKAIVVVFLSFDCPVSTSYSPTLIELAKDYGPRGVAFLGISPTDDDVATVAKHAKEFGLPFPVLKDEKLVAADALKAEITPEAFVLDGQFYQLRYRGRIDNSYAARLKKNTQTTKFDLKQALDELLAGKDIGTPVTEAVGCSIVRETKSKPSTGSVTYYRDVAPILQKNCQSCHRPGEVGPFSLMSYKQAVNWASDIKEYTQKREMPPWKPVEGPAFRDARKMTDKEIATLAAWVDGNTPAGDPKDAPPPAKFTKGWQLGEPDLVLSADSDFVLGASGRDVFRCFVLPTKLDEDKYITALEVRPGNPRVVHHTLNFIDTGGRGRKFEQQEKDRPKKDGEKDSGPGYSMSMGIGFIPNGAIGGWAPGQLARHLPDNTGYFLPKGSDVVLQVHYHRDGREEKDRTQIGLYFAKRPAAKRFQGMVLPGRFLFLPAGADDFKVKGTITVDQDCTIHSIMPHMHMLGKQIRVTMTPPGGEATPLINIKEWEYNWQETYFFKEPIAVKAGTRFDVEAHYDNSAKNPKNPNNPPKLVHFGEQTTDEMCFVFFGATSDRPGRIRVKFNLQ
jgi:peroxiredoxin/mono/diheme cytochrome c family protein